MEGKTDARFAAYLSPTTNDTNECPQVLVDVVVLRNHPTSTINDNEAEDSATNGQVDGTSHEGTSGKVKTACRRAASSHLQDWVDPSGHA